MMQYRNKFLDIYSFVHKSSRNILNKRQNKHRYHNLKIHGIPLKKLTAQQKKQIDNIWEWCKKTKDYSTHELIYSVTGEFNPQHCPDRFFAAEMILTLNNESYLKSWTDKNYFEKYFPDIKFPKAIVRNINGVYYDCEYNIINKQQAIELMKNYQELCIKPTVRTGRGNSVKKIKIDEGIEKIIDSYKKDFIIQEIVSQYEPIKALNPTSVNVTRVITLFINGEATIVSASLRCGALGSFTDNSITADGKGMFVIGITDDGILKDKAYYTCGVSIEKSHSGAEFAGLQLPNYEKAKEISLKIARQMPFVGLVAFDIVFDEDGNPIVMEYNLYGPGMYSNQIVNGPLFGDRTQEVIDYINKMQK